MEDIFFYFVYLIDNFPMKLNLNANRVLFIALIVICFKIIYFAVLPERGRYKWI